MSGEGPQSYHSISHSEVVETMFTGAESWISNEVSYIFLVILQHLIHFVFNVNKESLCVTKIPTTACCNKNKIR